MYELSEVERDFLSQGEADITFHTISTTERLEDSGLLAATWFTQPADHENFGHWRITDAGRAALDEPAGPTGAQAEVAPNGPCTYCKGEGQIVREFYGGAGGFGGLTCPACGGSGKRADEIERRARMARNEPVFADAPAVDRAGQADDANATTPPSPWPARFLQAAEDAKEARASAERWAQRADALEVRYAALVDAAQAVVAAPHSSRHGVLIDNLWKALDALEGDNE